MPEQMTDKNQIISRLQSQLLSLQDKVQVLEAENARLLSQVADCRCIKKVEIVDGAEAEHLSSEERGDLKAQSGTVKKKKVKKKMQDIDIKAPNHCNKRYIALKVMYFGQRFYGFASEAQMDPTVEHEIFKALEKTRLISGDKKEIQYSRCGRTDKGVSSVGQVIALFLRSNLQETFAIEGEIDYVRVLNRVLPRDIRVTGWCPVPAGFSARFSCLSREYKYFFWKENLDILAMGRAGKKFIGEHDFRNFCKMDAANVHNYKRHITSFEISPCKMRFDNDELWAIKIKGSAFLWHQVRCMVSVLFMVGRGLESPDIIDVLLDTATMPRKPQYAMAPEIPLVLLSCEFEGLEFICSSDSRRALCEHFVSECQAYQLQAAIYWEGLESCMTLSKDKSSLGDDTIRKKVSHVPLMLRPTEPSYEERHAKLKLKT